jgi:oligoribonuclease NrnB/cAMP/cGMP phosphodiesterase (DHH superfamily)
MSEELIVFTHNDLDALGCMLNIEFKMPGIKKKYYHTNYKNIPDIVDQIEAHIKEHGNTHILMPDVSFSDNKEHLRRLYTLGKCTHIDHHLYPDGFWDEFPDMKVVWDKTKSATLLCNEFFQNTGKNQSLDNLTHLIDVYDLWQTKSKYFGLSQDLNEYVWTHDLGLLSQKIVENDFNLPADFKDTVHGIREKYTKDIADFRARGLVQRSGDVTFAFVNDWFNQVLIEEMNNGVNVVVGISKFGITKVRINQDSDFTKEQLDRMRLELTGTSNIGHNLAFTYKCDTPKGFESLIDEAKKISCVIEQCRA